MLETSKETLCFVGSGGVATHLSVALREAGHEVVGVYSRCLNHARSLTDQLGLPAGCASDNLATLPAASVYILSVKDDALPDVVRSLATRSDKAHETAGEPALYVHTAGSIPLEALAALDGQKAVLYPLQTLSKQRPVDCRHRLPLFVEGSSELALSRVRALAESISDTVCRADSAQRALLHLSAVFACNFVNHCYDMAFGLLREARVDPSCLLPLIDETAAKLHVLSPHEAQTGPAVRNDRTVMQRHLEALSSMPDMQRIYGAMSEDIVRAFATSGAKDA